MVAYAPTTAATPFGPAATLMASLLMMFVIQAFKIPSASMQNTLLVGDHLFVNKFLYGLRVPFNGKRILPIRQPKRGGNCACAAPN